MNMAFIKRLEISHEKRLEIAFYKNNGKAIKKLQQLWDAQSMQLSLYAKSSLNLEP